MYPARDIIRKTELQSVNSVGMTGAVTRMVTRTTVRRKCIGNNVIGKCESQTTLHRMH